MGIQNVNKMQSFNVLKIQRYIDCDLMVVHYVSDNLIVVRLKPYTEWKRSIYVSLTDRLRTAGFRSRKGWNRLYYLTNDETIDIADKYRKLGYYAQTKGYDETNLRAQKLIEQNLVIIHNINKDCLIVHLKPIKDFTSNDNWYITTSLQKCGFTSLNQFDRIYYKSNKNIDYIINECVKLGYCVRNKGYDEINPRIQKLIDAELLSFHHVNGNIFAVWLSTLPEKDCRYLHRWFKSKNYVKIPRFNYLRIVCLVNNSNAGIKNDCYELTVKLGLRDSEEDRMKKYNKKRKLNSQRPETKKRKCELAAKYRKQPETKQIRNNRHKTRLNTDFLYKLTVNIRGLISISIKKQGYKKSSKTEQILGCSFEKFKQYIELQFESWMTWENYGKYKKGQFNIGWDFDHIIPLSSIKLLPLEERINRLYELNRYTNFRPLCSKINRDIKRDQFDVIK